MEQRHMINVPIGTTVRTSVRAPIDGEYEFVEHVASSACSPSGADVTAYMFRGQLLPRCGSCGKRSVWKLKEVKFDIGPEMDMSEYVLKNVRGDRPDVPYPSGAKK
jgi:hypothetical protein